MKRSLKDRITSIGLSYQKEILILVVTPFITLVTGVIIYYFFHELLIAIIVGMLGIFFDVFYVSRYSSIEAKQEKEHVDEFISLLAYFEIFISNGNNVYSSFKMLIPYSSIFMEDAINSLLSQIDMDKSVGPYINFASKFKSHVIESLLLSIYQMIDNGESVSQFTEFELQFTNIKNKFQEDRVESKKKSLDFLNSFPLIGAGFLTIVLSMSIISIIGEFTNVI